MSLFGFALVLAAAFCHATWNFFVKRINGGPELIWLFSVLSFLIYSPLAAYFIITGASGITLAGLGFIAGSAVLHLGYFLLLQTGYRHGDLSLIYPTARATGPLLSSSFAIVVLGETVGLQTGAGALTIILGVVFLTGGIRGRSKTQDGALGASMSFGLGAGVLIGSYTVWDAFAVSSLMIPPLLLDYASSAGRSILLLPVALKRREAMLGHWQAHRTGVLIIALFNPLAYILVLYALTFTPVVYVAPTREISVLLTVLMGSLLLGEGDLRRRLVWASVILTGVVLLVTG